MKFLLTLCTTLVCFSSQAIANEVVVIKNDFGGLVDQYNDKWSYYKQHDTRVIISQRCMSACDRYMTLSNVCATPDAYFYFHGATISIGKSKKEHLDLKFSIYDSKVADTPKAFKIEQKYKSYAFFKVKHYHPETFLEDGISKVYDENDDGRYQVLLKVKGTMLVKPCSKSEDDLAKYAKDAPYTD